MTGEPGTPIDYFFDIKAGINFTLYLSYAIIKLIMFVQLLMQRWCRRTPYKSVGRDDETVSIVERAAPSCLWRVMLSGMRSLVLLVFGGRLGVVHKHKDEYRPDEEDEKKVPTLHIRNTRLDYQAIELLVILIFSFAIIAMGTALNTSLLSVTRICSEDPNIHCYAEAIDGNDDIQKNITHGKEITDCAFWNSEGISSRVTFTCFRFKNSFGIFIAVFSGMLTILSITMKVVTTVLLLLGEQLYKSKCCCSCCDLETVKCICFCFKLKNFKHTRIVLALAAFVVEYIIFFLSFVYATLAIEDGTTLELVQQNLPKAAVAVGIISTTLWLPWEKYAAPSDNDNIYMNDI